MITWIWWTLPNLRIMTSKWSYTTLLPRAAACRFPWTKHSHKTRPQETTKRTSRFTISRIRSICWRTTRHKLIRWTRIKSHATTTRIARLMQVGISISRAAPKSCTKAAEHSFPSKMSNCAIHWTSCQVMIHGYQASWKTSITRKTWTYSTIRISQDKVVNKWTMLPTKVLRVSLLPNSIASSMPSPQVGNRALT